MSNILCDCPFKNRLLMFMTVLSLLLINVKAQAHDRATQTMPELPQAVRPSKGIVIAVLSILFALTFLSLAYVKFCRIIPLEVVNQNSNLHNLHGPTRSGSRFSSGIDRQVIETLPFFKFSSLKGSKEGLECAVCLSKFEDTEILRLLPKCKHAFHMNCIDKWLESHSTCPLCRCRVDPADIKNLAFSISSRFLRVPSNITEDPNVEIFVQREPSNRGSSRRTMTNKEELLLDQEGNSSGTNWKPVHKFNHRIVISDVVSRSRWSDLNSSDLLSLSTEMLNDMSSTRFSSRLELTATEKVHGTSTSLLPSTSNEEENSFTSLIPAEKRSMSEIARVPRFAETLISKQNRNTESAASSGNDKSEERLWRIWLPMARRTVQWFAREERNSRELEHKPLATNV